MAATGQGRASARVNVAGRGETNIATGVPVLNHLLSALAVHASFDLALEVAPGAPEAEISIAARSLGEALSEPLRAEGARGHGSAVVPADEALAHVALEAAGLTLHVRLVEGRDTQHVLEAIFKALGVALAQACRPRRREGP